jgi:hypothetical protein
MSAPHPYLRPAVAKHGQLGADRLRAAEDFDEALLERLFGDEPEPAIDCSLGDRAVVLACILAAVLMWLLPA